MSANIDLKEQTWAGVNKMSVPLEGGGRQVFSLGGGTPTLQTKTKTYTPTTSQQTDTISPDSGYDGLSLVNVIVNAMQGGADVPTFTLSGVQNGATVTCDKTYAEVRALYNDGLLVALANVPTYNCVYAMSICDEPGASSLRYAVYDANGYPMGDVLITSSAMTYSVPSVTQKTMNLPTATKGTVTNHTMTIGVGVTNSRGFYASGVTRGNPIYVSASELVSGSQTVSGNGTYDVTDLAELIVDTPTMTLPATTSSSPTGTRRANLYPSTSQQYLNIPAGLNDTARYYQIIGMDLAPLNVTQNGTYNASDVDITGFNTVTVDVQSGAPNIVQGDFHTQSSAGYMNINLPYTGSGYPIVAVVVVKDGAYNPNYTHWYSTIQRYAVGQWTMSKSVMTSAPTYTTSGTQNQGVVTSIYKNSTSSSNAYTRTSSMNTNVFSSNNASNSAVNTVKFKTGNVMSVYVNTSSYGLLPQTDYSYFIIYSE